MQRWQRHTTIICPSAYFNDEGYKQSSYLQGSSSVIIIADAGAWPHKVPGEILAV
jgi:hypothetical protein